MAEKFSSKPSPLVRVLLVTGVLLIVANAFLPDLSPGTKLVLSGAGLLVMVAAVVLMAVQNSSAKKAWNARQAPAQQAEQLRRPESSTWP